MTLRVPKTLPKYFELNASRGRTRSKKAVAFYITDAFHCDFGRSDKLTICDMYQEQQDDGDWMLGKGKTASLDTGPLAGHSQGDKEDMYLYLEASVMDTGAKTMLVFLNLA